MPSRAIEALRSDRAVVLEVCGRLGEDDWAAGSGCPGWSVRDLIAHLGALYWMVVDQKRLPDVSGLPTERAQDALVDSRRSWTPAAVVEDYAAVSSEAIDRLAGLAGQTFALPLGDLGTYPAGMLPNAYAFDHHLHLRDDLFAPRGPLAGPPPATTPAGLEAAIDWVEAALPQQNADAVGSLGGAVEIILEPPVARTITLGAGEPVAKVSSAPEDFVRCITQRRGWDEPKAVASGDPAAVTILRSLRVF